MDTLRRNSTIKFFKLKWFNYKSINLGYIKLIRTNMVFSLIKIIKNETECTRKFK